jgi:hypothetical protein
MEVEKTGWMQLSAGCSRGRISSRFGVVSIITPDSGVISTGPSIDRSFS